jgi:hypothetical protein
MRRPDTSEALGNDAGLKATCPHRTGILIIGDRPIAHGDEPVRTAPEVPFGDSEVGLAGRRVDDVDPLKVVSEVDAAAPPGCRLLCTFAASEPYSSRGVANRGCAAVARQRVPAAAALHTPPLSELAGCLAAVAQCSCQYSDPQDDRRAVGLQLRDAALETLRRGEPV